MPIKEDKMFSQEILDNYDIQILDAKFEQVGINKVAINLKHLNINQLHNLQQVLAKCGKLFDVPLGVYPHQKVHIDLLPGLQHVPHQAYPLPWAHEQTFKKELQHMVDMEFSKNVVPLSVPWLASLLPKQMTKSEKTLTPTHLTNAPNEKISAAYIHTIMQKISGYKYFTKLDIWVQYNTCELDQESQDQI